MVALLKDFRRVSVLSLWSVFDGSSIFDVCVVGNWSSIRGDFCGGAESGLADEHLFAVSPILALEQKRSLAVTDC